MPKIEAIALYELLGTRPTLLAPCANAGVRPAEARENLLVVVTDDGRRGVASWPEQRPDPPASDLWWLVGRDPRSVFGWDGAYVSRAAPEPQMKACAPIDLALLDLAGQIEKRPLWQLLGPEQHATLPGYYSSLFFEDLLEPDSTVDDVVRCALAATARGHRALKIKVGRGLRWMSWPECTERDIDVVRAVRGAVGPEIALMLDGDGGFAGYVADAADFVVEVAPLGLEFVQALVDDHEVAELRDALRAAGVDVPVAGGANWGGLACCQAKWPRCPFDILQIDTCRIGIMEHASVARFALDNGLRIAPSAFGSHIAMLAGLHLGRAAAAYAWCECDESRFDGYDAPGYTLNDGRYQMPSTPGLGVSVSTPELTAPSPRGARVPNRPALRMDRA